jgi:small-conductance mechanosensitive channel
VFSSHKGEQNLPEIRRNKSECCRADATRLTDHRVGMTIWRFSKFLALVALVFFQSTLASAASAASDAAEPMAALLEEARASGLRVIILEPGIDGPEAGASAAGHGFGETVTDLTGRLVQRFGEVVDAAPGQFSDFAAKVAALSPVNSAVWPVWVVLVTVIGLALGHLVFALLRGSLADRKPLANASEVPSRRVRIAFVLRSGVISLIGLVFEIGFGLLLPIVVFGNAAHTNAVISIAVEVAIVLRLALIFFDTLLLPDEPAMRMVIIGDDAARRMHRHVQAGLLIEFVLLVPALLLFDLENLPRELKVIAAMTGIGGGATVSCIVVWFNRLGLAQLFSTRQVGALTPLARKAWIIMIFYFVIAWLISSTRMLLDLSNALGLVGAPLAAVMIACVIRGAGIFLAERFSRDKPATEPSDNVETAEQEAGYSGQSHWLDEMTRVAAIGVAVVFVLDRWGISLARDDGSVGFLGISAITLFLAYAGWTAIRSYFDRKIAEEIGDVSDLEGDEGGGAGVSRLGTLLPLVRNVILFAVLLVAIMVLLIDLGVDIAPLFAGAGILGLAIGFGAQTLIRDIFSGLFFLIDDAFRTGEYVETGAAKGTVERISIRSMQLRHQNGPLHTIPFGEIQQLTNFSRDWVIMKLPLRVTLDTDPERVRKLVKKLGQELLGDPTVGHKFLQPLKSQGVLSIDNFGMVVRIKFMTRPGDQFVTRRVVYARIHELFEREGIEFASRDVRIRMDKEGAAGGEISRAAAVATELAEATDAENPAAGAGGNPDDQR